MRIWLSDKVLDKEQIVVGSWDTVSDYERQTLDFCQRWLQGEQTFSLHTSGSTGQPKPIVLLREQMEASARLTGEALGLERGMCALVCLNTAYVAGTMMLVRGLELGMDMIIVEPTRNPLASEQLTVKSKQLAFTAMVPMQVEAVLDDESTRPIFEGLHSVLIGGAPVSERLVARLQAVDAACYHTYGMTETVTHIALRRLNGLQASARFVPLDGVMLALDERDCLTIRGPMTLGKTVVTNDRVDLAEDGSFVWLGRIDNVINSGGVKVQAEKVERALRKALRSKRVFVVGMPDDVLGERVVAFVEARPELVKGIDPTQLNGLNKYERPKEIIYIEKFLETPTGKIDRQATVKEAQRPLR